MTWNPKRVPEPKSSRMNVAEGESLYTAHDDTVGDDQTDVYGQLLADLIGVCLEELVDENYEQRYEHQLDDDSYTVGNRIAQQGCEQA